MKSFRAAVGVFAFAALLMLLANGMVWGQTGTSTISGVVTDPQGAVVPGATVTLTGAATNFTRKQKAGPAGAFTFALIPPGDYRMEVEAQGFKRKVLSQVHAVVGTAVDASVALDVGPMAETVIVEAGGSAVHIDTQDATLGNYFETVQITQLPLEARALLDMLSLQPGATREGYITGARADQSNVTLDGVDINNAQSSNAEIPRAANSLVIGQLDTDRGNITTAQVLRLNTEAIEEFRITTANATANQGHSSGGQVTLVTKSGSNNWHGAAFEFYRGTLFEANDWYSNRAGVPPTPLVRNTFGGALGGPVVKDKAFFFYSYEGRHDATAQAKTRVVPLASLGRGIINYTYCTNAACNSPQTASLSLTQNQQVYQATGINQLALNALAAAAARYPANDTSVGDGLNTSGFRFNATTPTTLNSHVAKMDFNLTNNQTAFVRMNVIYDHQTLPGRFPDTPSPLVWSHPWGLAVGHNWTLGGRWVNNFRYGLTRQAFTQGGDSNGNDISFRFVFQPTGQQHSLTRVTPVHNITDDLSLTHGKHTFQFGANIRAISNSRVSFANAFDNAVTNPSFYLGAGDHVSNAFQDYLTANNLPGGQAGQSLNSISEVQNAATAIIGRFSQYTANFTFNTDGTLFNPGTPANRTFATQAYEEYIQDTWKIHPSLTLSLGLRYSLERPVYETQGFEVQPTLPLGTYFAKRLAAAAQGQNFSDPIVINRSGPANGGQPLYDWDKHNFQPRIGAAWTPNFSNGFLRTLFGSQGKSVIRGGFAMTNDYYGQALAVDWDLNNTLGFTSNFTTPANTYDTAPCGGCKGLAPLFTGFGQNVRSLPNVVVPGKLQFPLSQPLDEGERIELAVDSQLHAPRHYVWNLTYERQMRAGTVLSLSYIGRIARSLLARRDVTAFNNVVDPKSGMDWYTAGTILEKQRQQGVPTSQIASIPFFDNLFPANLVTLFNTDPNIQAGFPANWTPTQVFYGMQSRTPSNPFAFFAGNDWTDAQAQVDIALFDAGLPTRFMQPQYGALSVWSTIGNSNYHAFTVTLRQRLRSWTLDFNYSYSHSLDDASGLQTETGYASSAFIVNPIRQGDNYGNSDFDIRHSINATALWQMPFGRGRALLTNANRVVDAILGGWQLSGILRWNTGLPTESPFDDARWATNWNVQARVTPTAPVTQTCPERPTSGPPKLYGPGCDIKAIYQSFRNAYPGESGPRNYIRLPGYMDSDLGLAKTWNMPWSEKQQLQLRWDVFNVANLQRFGFVSITRTGFGVARDPARRGLNPPTAWSNLTQIQGLPRVMQVAARFSF